MKLTDEQRIALLHVKDGAHLYPVHIGLGVQLMALARAGLVEINHKPARPDNPLEPAPIAYASLTATGREALGLTET